MFPLVAGTIGFRPMPAFWYSVRANDHKITLPSAFRLHVWSDLPDTRICELRQIVEQVFLQLAIFLSFGDLRSDSLSPSLSVEYGVSLMLSINVKVVRVSHTMFMYRKSCLFTDTFSKS